MPLSFPSRRLRCSPVYLSRAVTTGPNTRVEVSVLGRLDMFLKTREPPSCFAGAPTSVWHRSRPSPFLSQRFSRDMTAKVIAGEPLFVGQDCMIYNLPPAEAGVLSVTRQRRS